MARACWRGIPAEGESAPFGDQIAYGVGADLSVNPRVTLAFDLLGRYFIDAERLRAEDFHALDGRSVFPNIVFEQDSFNAMSGAMGLKANAFGRFLIDVNVLFKLDEHGLRDKVTPLIGLNTASKGNTATKGRGGRPRGNRGSGPGPGLQSPHEGGTLRGGGRRPKTGNPASN